MHALNVLAKVTRKEAEREAASACFFLAYQPKVPGKLKEHK